MSREKGGKFHDLMIMGIGITLGVNLCVLTDVAFTSIIAIVLMIIGLIGVIGSE